MRTPLVKPGSRRQTICEQTENVSKVKGLIAPKALKTKEPEQAEEKKKEPRKRLSKDLS